MFFYLACSDSDRKTFADELRHTHNQIKETNSILVMPKDDDWSDKELKETQKALIENSRKLLNG